MEIYNGTFFVGARCRVFDGQRRNQKYAFKAINQKNKQLAKQMFDTIFNEQSLIEFVCEAVIWISVRLLNIITKYTQKPMTNEYSFSIGVRQELHSRLI